MPATDAWTTDGLCHRRAKQPKKEYAMQLREQASLSVMDHRAPVVAETGCSLSRLQKSDQMIRMSCRGLRGCSMVLGWEGYFFLACAGWRKLGYQGADAYIDTLPIGRSTFYKMVAIAKRFITLDREAFLEMTVENASRLSAYDPDTRCNPNLVSKAATMTSIEFESLLDAFPGKIETPGEKTAAKSTLKVSAATRTAVEKWQNEHNIETKEEALNLMIRECSDRGTLVGFMSEWLHRFRAGIATADDAQKTRELLKTYLDESTQFLGLVNGSMEATKGKIMS
jgi:hypothetical protein